MYTQSQPLLVMQQDPLPADGNGFINDIRLICMQAYIHIFVKKKYIYIYISNTNSDYLYLIILYLPKKVGRKRKERSGEKVPKKARERGGSL